MIFRFWFDQCGRTRGAGLSPDVPAELLDAASRQWQTDAALRKWLEASDLKRQGALANRAAGMSSSHAAKGSAGPDTSKGPLIRAWHSVWVQVGPQSEESHTVPECTACQGHVGGDLRGDGLDKRQVDRLAAGVESIDGTGGKDFRPSMLSARGTQ